MAIPPHNLGSGAPFRPAHPLGLEGDAVDTLGPAWLPTADHTACLWRVSQQAEPDTANPVPQAVTKLQSSVPIGHYGPHGLVPELPDHQNCPPPGLEERPHPISLSTTDWRMLSHNNNNNEMPPSECLSLVDAAIFQSLPCWPEPSILLQQQNEEFFGMIRQLPRLPTPIPDLFVAAVPSQPRFRFPTPQTSMVLRDMQAPMPGLSPVGPPVFDLDTISSHAGYSSIQPSVAGLHSGSCDALSQYPSDTLTGSPSLNIPSAVENESKSPFQFMPALTPRAMPAGRRMRAVGATQCAGDHQRELQSTTGMDTGDEPIGSKRKRDAEMHIIPLRSDGKVYGYRTVLGTSDRKPKKPYTPEQQRATTECRKHGACTGCQMGKRKCDLHKKGRYEPCTMCMRKPYKGIIRIPCFQSNISDCTFFRKGKLVPQGDQAPSLPCRSTTNGSLKGPSCQSPLYFQSKSTYDLSDVPSAVSASGASREIKTLELYQLDEKISITIFVARFEPQGGDMIDHREYNAKGKECVLEMPPYSLTNMKYNVTKIEQYIFKNRFRYIEPLKQSNEITQVVIDLALGYIEQDRGSMTARALWIWICSRVIEKQWKIRGGDSIGLSAPTDPDSPWYGFVPVTPMMDGQLDQIVIQTVLRPERQALLKLLENSINENRPETWLDRFLTFYILLNHIEFAAAHCKAFAKSSGLGQPYSDLTLADGWFHTCQMLLSRFHFVWRGQGPFQLDWTKDSTVQAFGVNEGQRDSIITIQDLLSTRGDYFDELNMSRQYESEMYWTKSLFAPSWKAEVIHLGADEGKGKVTMLNE